MLLLLFSHGIGPRWRAARFSRFFFLKYLFTGGSQGVRLFTVDEVSKATGCPQPLVPAVGAPARSPLRQERFSEAAAKCGPRVSSKGGGS